MGFDSIFHCWTPETPAIQQHKVSKHFEIPVWWQNWQRNRRGVPNWFSPVFHGHACNRGKEPREKHGKVCRNVFTSYANRGRETITAPDKCGSRKRLFAEIDSDQEKDLSGSELSEQELVRTPTKPREWQSFGKEQVSNRKVTETKSTNEEENQPEWEKTGKRKKLDGVITESGSSEKGLLRRATEREEQDDNFSVFKRIWDHNSW